MEQFRPYHIEKLPTEARDVVRKKIESLHAEFGDTFSMEETPDEYIIVQGERKTHIIKHPKIFHSSENTEVEDKNKKLDTWLLADVIEAQIRFPELETSGEQMKALETRTHIPNESKNSPD